MLGQQPNALPTDARGQFSFKLLYYYILFDYLCQPFLIVFLISEQFFLRLAKNVGKDSAAYIKIRIIAHANSMEYYNYHGTVKRLIAEGKLKKWQLVEEYHGITPVLLLFFDDDRHPVMPIREDRFEEYFDLIRNLPL